MKSFNPNTFLSKSLTHARKIEDGICEGIELDGGGDEEREVRKGETEKDGWCTKNHRKLLCICWSCVDCIMCHHHTHNRLTPVLLLLCRKCLRRRCFSWRSVFPLTRPQQLWGQLSLSFSCSLARGNLSEIQNL